MSARPTLTLKSTRLASPDVSPSSPELDQFWFVWNPARMRPKKRHSRLDQAMAEAARLRAATPGESFHVFEARRCES
jgi:hypothetical protein